MSTSVVETLIAKARGMPIPADGEITPDTPKPKQPPQQANSPKPAEPLPRPAEIITPAGTRYRFVIPPEGSEGAQVWQSDSLEELCGKLFKSLQHSNAYIQRQKRKLTELSALLASISTYVVVLSQLRGDAAEAELVELQKIISQRHI